MLRTPGALAILAAVTVAGASAQTPQPFPKPGETRPQAPAVQPPPRGGVQAPQPAPAADAAGDPTEATLGLPIYPGAQFVASYNAGRGQRYYLFGTTSDFAQIVTYYKAVLKQRGELVYEEPPIHMFEVGRFREETMAFPPGVTVKDWTWGGSQGYPNPRRGVQPSRFPTIIMIVPPPPVTPAAK